MDSQPPDYLYQYVYCTDRGQPLPRNHPGFGRELKCPGTHFDLMLVAEPGVVRVTDSTIIIGLGIVTAFCLYTAWRKQ